MVEQDRAMAERMSDISGLLNSAFDLASYGMGIHLHSIATFTTGQKLPKWANLTNPNSNYLADPYLSSWRWGIDQKDFGPHATSPYSKNHLRLFTAMGEEYEKLGILQIRFFLGREPALAVPDPKAPITNEEFASLLDSANKSGLITYDPKTPTEIEAINNDTDLAIYLSRNRMISLDNFRLKWNDINPSNRFREQTLKAGIYKLGVMLGVTEQLAYDANALGFPIPSEYKPIGLTETLEANWKKLFGEPMPGIAELYRHAHRVFAAHASPNDPLIKYLFAIKELPHLK